LPDAPAAPEPTAEQVAATIRSKRYLVLLVIAAVVGVIVSLVAWCFLELVHQLQQELFTHLPHALGYHSGPPDWWSLPVLAVGAVITALAILRLPGNGGHLPAKGLGAGGPPLGPIDVPGVVLAGLATIGFGLVLGPEAPLIALGSGVALLTIRLSRREMPSQTLVVIGVTGSFAALSFIFASPLIAAVLLIEAAGIGGARMRLVLLPGLMAAGIGTLVSLGMGSFTGLSSSAYAISSLDVPHFGHPHFGQFAWTIGLALAVAIVTRVIIVGGLATYGLVVRRLLLLLPIVALIVAGLAIAFHGITGRSVNEVLFSGQDALPGLVAQAASWSLGTLALLILFKGAAYAVCLGSFRGGPTFPAIFLGAAGGIMASHLPGYALAPAVAVGIGAATAAVLRLPLSAAILATFVTIGAGTGDEPLIIVGVVVAYVATIALTALVPDPAPGEARRDGAPAPAPPVGSATPARAG
jgi:H+/Cl- antiporter ClcA